MPSMTNLADKRQKPPASAEGFCVAGPKGPQYSRLTLAELFATTCFVEADFFTFDFTGIASNKTSLLQRRLKRFVVVDERAGNTVRSEEHKSALQSLMRISYAVF